MECASSKHVPHNDLLPTFGFAGLVPLHPAYARFLRSINLSIANETSRAYTSRYPYAHFIDESPEILRITNPHSRAWEQDGNVPHTPQYTITAEQLTTFTLGTQASLDATISCHCIRLIHLGTGTYTLRRPPGPEREKCKAASWKGMEGRVDYDLRHPRKGNGQYENDYREPEMGIMGGAL